MSSLNAKNRLSKPFVKNSKIIFTLPLGGKIRMGRVILTGNVVLSAGTTSGTKLGEGGPVNLIKRIFVTATPSGGSRYPGGKVVDIDARSLLRFGISERQGKYFDEQSGSTLGGGAAGTYPIYLSVPIYWADAVQKNSLLTALNTDVDPSTNAPVYASVQVEVDTGDITSCFSGNDRTQDYSGLTVQWVDERVAVPGDTSVLYQESHALLIPATNKRMLDEAMPQDGQFMSWQFLTEASAQQNLADTLLNRIVSAGPTLDLDLYAQDIRQRMLDDEWIDPSTTATGVYFIDFTDGAVQANTIAAGSLQTYYDVNNVSGANLDDILVSTRRVIAPVPAAASK